MSGSNSRIEIVSCCDHCLTKRQQ